MEGSRGVNIDDIDLKIINHLYHLKRDEKISTYELTTNVLKLPHTKQPFVKYRLGNLAKYGIVDVHKNGEVNPTHYYGLLSEKVRVRRMKIKDLGVDSQAIFLNLDGKWCSFLI